MQVTAEATTTTMEHANAVSTIAITINDENMEN